MMNELKKLLALSAVTLLAACGADDPTGPGTEPGDGAGDNGGSETRTGRASLEAAVPADGAVVRGEFLLGALVDSVEPVEVRFLVDGVEVGATNELPYQLTFNACDLTVGNHAYIVTIEGQDGTTDFKEQFFEAACD